MNKNVEKIISNHLDEYLHYTMSVMGGFFGTYAICSYGGTFGSAQTGNILYMMIELTYCDLKNVFWKMGAFFLYSFTLAAAFFFSHYKKWNVRVISLWIDMMALLVTMILPENIPRMVWLYPIFIATSFQWIAYSGAKGYNSPSTFSTGNLRQCVLSWTEYLISQKVQEKKKAIFYTATILFFALGAYVGSMSVYYLGKLSSLVGMIPLCVVGIMLMYDKKRIEIQNI